MIKNKLKILLSELKKSKVQTILVFEYKNGNDHKNFHSCTQLMTLMKHLSPCIKALSQK